MAQTTAVRAAEATSSFGVVLAGEQRGHEFPWQLERPAAQHWVQLQLGHESEAWLLNRGGIEPTAFQALMAMGARPRCASFENGSLVVLRGVNLNPGAEPEDMVSVRIWLEGERVITLTPRPVESVTELHDQLARGRGPSSGGGVVIAIANRLLDRLAPIVAELDEETDHLQERLVGDDLAGWRIDLARLRRRLIQFRRHLAPQREALLKLMREQYKLFPDALGEHLREVCEKTGKHVEDVVALAERATVMHDELESRLGERMSRNMHFMSQVTVMFLPLSFVTSLLGINVGGIPWADSEHGFMWVGGMLILLMIGQAFVMRRLRLLRAL
jgi:zinc transporter